MTLPTDVYSPDQVSTLTMELRSFMDARADASRRSHHDEQNVAKSELLESLFESSPRQDAHQLLEELEALLKSAPVVHIITAVLPAHGLKQQLTTWFRQEVHEHTLLTFAERRDIGGGIVVRAGSQLYDFSFKHKILDNKHRITEIAFPPAPAQPEPAGQSEVANV